MPGLSKSDEMNSSRVAATRARHAEAGRVYVHIDLPKEIVAHCDDLKKKRRAQGRSAIIEAALKEYLSKQ
ncbi:ribbon-helix-helix protein, CopG family [Agrobacterium tumefaciens]|nr:ribbon-helix-helix protein, CopG family [Agrobacterium tumefaciens]